MTTDAIQAYPFHATEKNVVRIGVLKEAAKDISRAYQAVRLFLCLSASVYGRAGQGPQGRWCLTSTPTCSVPPTMIGVVVGGSLNELEAHIMTELTVLTTKIRQLDGLYCLNDLHKAAGGEEKHAPANFIRLDQTQALIAELCSAEMQIIPTKTIRGRGKQQGTYVCKELVIAYAAWISAAFHLKVIRVFLEQVNPEVTQAEQIAKQVSKHLQRALPSQDCLLPEHQAKEILDRLYRLCQLFHPF
ncbi:KilA-N domain-containing protein, partial [Nitrosomonas communis]|uniref:KilA-N domain-containing protein n=1 Tax=Nitrosomonas communis TaxID=44574 RepID=UPI003D2C2C0B